MRALTLALGQTEGGGAGGGGCYLLSLRALLSPPMPALWLEALSRNDFKSISNKLCGPHPLAP